MSRQSGGGFYRWATLFVSAIGVLVAVIVATEDGQIPAFAKKAAGWIGWAEDPDPPPAPIDPPPVPIAPSPAPTQTPTDPPKQAADPPVEAKPTPSDPAPERSAAPTRLEVLANDSGNFCGMDYLVTFRKRGSGLDDRVYLRRGDKHLTLGQHDPQEIDPGCRVTFLGFDERSNDYARFSVSE